MELRYALDKPYMNLRCSMWPGILLALCLTRIARKILAAGGPLSERRRPFDSALRAPLRMMCQENGLGALLPGNGAPPSERAIVVTLPGVHHCRAAVHHAGAKRKAPYGAFGKFHKKGLSRFMKWVPFCRGARLGTGACRQFALRPRSLPSCYANRPTPSGGRPSQRCGFQAPGMAA